MSARAECPLRAELGECPVWDEESDSIAWVDIDAGLVHRHPPSGPSTTLAALPGSVGVLAPRAGGGFVAGVGRRTALMEPDGRWAWFGTGLLPDGRRFNDGACDAAGRLWAGSTHRDFGAAPGSLHRLDPDGTLHTVVERVAFSNGLGFSPDGTILYLIDSLAWVLLAFPFDLATAALGAPQPLVAFLSEEGLPDGLAVDAAGDLWVARYGAYAVEHYTPGGTLAGRIRVPVAQPTGLAFSADRLWIASAREFLDTPGELDGALLSVDVGVGGVPPARFAA